VIRKMLVNVFVLAILIAPLAVMNGSKGEGGERGPGETILYVDDDGGSTYTSIQDAVDDAGPHTTIVVNPGSYGSVEIRDKSDLTIEGNGSSYEDVIIAAGFSTNPSFAISRSTNITVTGVTVSLSLSSYAFYVSRSDNVSIIRVECGNLNSALGIFNSADVLLVGTITSGPTAIVISDSRRITGGLMTFNAYGDSGAGIAIYGSGDINLGWLMLNITGENSTFIRGSGCWNVTFSSLGGIVKNYMVELFSGEVKLIGIDLPDHYFSVYSGARLSLELQRFVFVRDESNTTAIEGADLLLTVDGEELYSTEHYGGTDGKSDGNGRFLLYLVKRLFDGTNTSVFPQNDIRVWYGGGDVEREVVLSSVDTAETSPIYVLLPDFEAPSPPQNVTAEAVDENTVQISFDPSNSTDVVEYRIYSNDTGNWTLILNSTHAGDFLIENLEAGREYWFKVVAVDDAGIESEGVIVNATTPPPTKGTLSGWVLYQGGPLDGQNASGASVTLYNSTHQEVASAVLGEDGRFTFHNISFADGYLLEITPQDPVVYGGNQSGYCVWRGLINFTEEREMTVHIRYYEYVPPTEGALSGVVIYSGGPHDGEKAAGVSVEVYSNTTLVKSSTADENGTFTIENLTFGVYRIVFVPPDEVAEGGNRSGYVRVEVELNFTEDKIMEVTVPYYNYTPPPPPTHPKVRILDKDGEPVEGVTVKATVNGTVYTATTDEEGWAIFTGFEGDFPPGTEFSAEKEGYKKITWREGETPPPLEKEEKQERDYIYLLLLLVVILLLIGAILLLRKKGEVEEE